MDRSAIRATIGLTAALLASTTAGATGHWPQFRGPGSQGVSTEINLPTRWSATENIVWKTPLPGPGHSSPIVWGDRVFLTAFRSDRSLGNWFGRLRGDLVVLSIDARSGRVLWERKVPADAIEEVHTTNSPASPTPVTDGERVYVYFGSRGLVAFDFEGRQVWETRLGPYPNAWGSASSPILHGDRLILNVDTDGDDFLLAVDRRSGRTVWRTPRADVNRSWPTPVVWATAGGDEIVVSGSGRVKGYDAASGRELWVVDGLTTWVSPTPVIAHGLLYVAANGPGGNIIMAIRPGGRGNVTRTHVAWRFGRAAPYVSSPVVVGDHLYTVKNGGLMTCLHARTGALVWQQRLPFGGDYYASLVAGDGRIYALSEDGGVSVVAARPAYQLLAENDLGERSMASPAIAGGRIYIRTDRTLFCIGRGVRS
jgi:outer membrane protein assembly factor BamB